MSLESVDSDLSVIPLPPSPLRYRVAGTDYEEWFTKSGKMSVRDFELALASIGKSLTDFDDVLDWGCGCGRILRHLPPPVAPKRLHGSDTDGEAVAWVAENLPWVETSCVDGMPPLAYPDNSFDLIYSHSVLSHLNEAYQDAWLAELARVLRPGGVAAVTFSGRRAFQLFLDTIPATDPAHAHYSEELHTKGLIFITEDQWAPDFPDFYHTTFHDVDYVFNHWAQFLTILSFIPRGGLDFQDMIVLQKPLIDSPPAYGSYLEYVNEQHRALSELRDTVLTAQRQRDASIQEAQRLTRALEQETAVNAATMLLNADALLSEQEARHRTHEALQRVYASRSWLLTKPWRFVGKKLKELVRHA